MTNTNHNDALTLPVLLKAGEPVLLKPGHKPGGPWISYNNNGRIWRMAVRQYTFTDFSRYLGRNLRLRSDFHRHLRLALNLYDKVEIGKFLLNHFPERENRTLWLQAMAKPLEEVSALLTIGMHGLMPVIWNAHEGQRLALGLLASREHQAAFALAAFRLLGRFGWAVCKRETCGNVFFPQRRKQEYCNHNCEMAEVMRRRRLRIKRSNKKGSQPKRRIRR
jgi:hypothetical protein